MEKLAQEWTIEPNGLYNLDCLEGLRSMPDQSIDMIYMDPPFFSQTTQKLSDRAGQAYAFEDKWESIDHYLSYLEVRIREMRRVLKDSGNLFVHCDRKASHYLRILLDQVFGYEQFQNEIIWAYRRWSNAKRGLLEGHQTIFNYSKTASFHFYPIYTDYSPTTNIDQLLQDRVRNAQGKIVYKRDAQGQIVFQQEKKGVPLLDVWEIPFLNPKAKERTGYPTQKPLELLERILKISTQPGDRILDPFCGSGTSLVAAKRLGRSYIGFDTNPSAIALSQARLNHPIKSNSRLLERGKAAYDTKTPREKQILANFDCNPVQRNKGLDAILRKPLGGSLAGIRIQKDQEPLAQALAFLRQAMQKRHFSKSILIRTNPAEEVETGEDVLLLDSYQAQLDRREEELEMD